MRTSALLSSITKPLWRHARALFVLSTGRTGTVTLTKLLNISPEIAAFHEPAPRHLELISASYADIWNAPSKYRTTFESARFLPIARTSLNGKVYCEATNLVYFAPAIAQSLPNALFLHLHRHPADVVRSGMSRGWYRCHEWDEYRLRPPQGTTWSSAWDTCDPFTKICWFWNATNEFILRFGERLTPDRVLTLSSEQLWSTDDDAWKSLFRFLGVAVPESHRAREVLRTRHNAQPLRPFPAFDDWTREQQSRLLHIAGATMTKLGYANHLTNASG